MSEKHIDNRKTYAIQKSTLEAVGIELVIAQKEYQKQLNRHTHLITGEWEGDPADEDFYKEQVEYLDGLISHLHGLTDNELLLI